MRSGTIAALLVIAILAGAGAGYLTGSANERTITSTFTSISTSTVMMTETTTTSATTTALESWAPYIFLTSSCYAGGGPCFGSSSPAYVFNSCPHLLTGPPTPYTCTYTVTSTLQPYPSYTIDITLGITGQAMGPEWANCSLATTGGEYADCIPVINSTAFIVAEQAPPPP